MDILTIALPAVLALAANPITALVDTAFVGHVGKDLASSLVSFLLLLSTFPLWSVIPIAWVTSCGNEIGKLGWHS
jgi:Na+-driven multidrug efflux pump